MIQSMTGYGKASGNSNLYTFEVEIRSVNSRFLDISVRLPRTLSSKEIEFRNLIKQRVKRGKVTLNINLSKDDSNPEAAAFDQENLLKVIETLNQVKNKAKIQEDLQLSHLLAFPDIFINDNLEFSEIEYESIKIALNEAINELGKMRKSEGESLSHDLRDRVQKINELNEEIKTLSRDSIEVYFSKLKDRAAELVEGIANNDDRLKIELALLAEKYDITEESVRMESHSKQFLETLDSGNEAGKKLNFLVQEMNREVNTMGNKSVSLDITNKSIVIKEELEKIREQIQNIE
ncbi:MAG: YicC/YloC family endoribonuclease [Bacteroidota bacterium]